MDKRDIQDIYLVVLLAGGVAVGSLLLREGVPILLNLLNLGG